MSRYLFSEDGLRTHGRIQRLLTQNIKELILKGARMYRIIYEQQNLQKNPNFTPKERSRLSNTFANAE